MEELCLDSGRRTFSRLGFAMLLYIAVTVTLQYLLSWLFARYMQNEWVRYIVLILPQYFISMPLAALLIWRMPRQPIAHKQLGAGRFVIVMIVCFAILYAGNLTGALANLGLQAIAGKEMSQALFSLITDSGVWTNVVFVVILAPIAEELFFRKLLIPKLLPFGEKPAIILSGLIFGLRYTETSRSFSMPLGWESHSDSYL